jgi:hypothetical protein
VVLRNDAGLWGFPWSADGTLPAVQAYRMDTPDGGQLIKSVQV